MENADS